MTVADRIKQRREELQLSQNDLAKRMGYTGKSSVSKIEHAGNEISLKTITKCAEALHTTTSYLMGWDENPVPVQVDFMIPGITEEEHALIEMYRSLDKDSRQNVSDMINRLYLYAKKLNELQKGGGDNGKH